MFEQALRAGLPVIGVSTDDPANLEAIVVHLVGAKPIPFPEKWRGVKLASTIYWTQNASIINVDLYRHLVSLDKQLLLVNAEPSPLVFDAGELPTPEPMLRELLAQAVDQEQVQGLYEVVRGLSLKATGEIIALTQVRTGGTLPSEVRKTRTAVMGATQGLAQVDTSYDFYLWPLRLKEWIELNKTYFLGHHHPRLVPRGLMLEGNPGVGKSMASKAIANAFGVPLYRIDIAATLVKFVGESEARLSRILALVEREAPCVVLIDEVEKLFHEKDDSGVTQRLLSQLLWWLAEHRAKVFVVMTTNDASSIPRELFRAGRIDLKLKLPMLDWHGALDFAGKVFAAVIGDEPTEAVFSKIETLLDPAQKGFAHADIAEITYTAIKQEGWA